MTNGNVLKRNATQSNNQAGQPDQAAQASQSKQTNQTNQAQAATTGATIAKLAMVITTYKRQNLLATLFDSILALEQAPWRIVVVDNEHSDETRGMVEEPRSPIGGARPSSTAAATSPAWCMRRRPRILAARAASPQA